MMPRSFHEIVKRIQTIYYTLINKTHLFWKPLLRRFGDTYNSKTTNLINTFSVTEKLLFIIGLCILILSTGFLSWNVYSYSTTVVPAQGGIITEGIIGSPRFINPILAVSDADHTLSSLIYTGLLKEMPNGKLAYNLAKKITINESGTTYTVTLKDGLTFHDGTPITARDVVYTVEQIQNPQIRSPHQGDWAGVTVDSIDKQTIQFTLTEPYSPFIHNLTIGILPTHIWKPLSSDQFSSSPHNDITPVGAGPYYISDINRNEKTLLTTYTLTPFSNHVLGEPFIETIKIRSFSNAQDRLQALKTGSIDAIGGIPPKHASRLSTTHHVHTANLPRMFGVFFNQNKKDFFANQQIRNALAQAINKEAIVNKTLHTYATPIHSPIPAELIPTHSINSTTTQMHISTRREQASSTLKSLGWEKDKNGIRNNDNGENLSFTLSTSNSPELIATANELKRQWKIIGIDVRIEIFSPNKLNRNVIRPRSYDALLFGKVIGHTRDFYPFWHSSQQNDPGLNIAQYTNIRVDEILETLRTTHTPNKQQPFYQEFSNIVSKENPAVFLYTPHYLYVLPNTLSNVTIGPVTVPRNRFNTIHQWYTRTNTVWQMFTDDTNDTEIQYVFPYTK